MSTRDRWLTSEEMAEGPVDRETLRSLVFYIERGDLEWRLRHVRTGEMWERLGDVPKYAADLSIVVPDDIQVVYRLAR